MAGASIQPISDWTEQQLWAAFMLVDGLHDYGDIGGTRSVRGAYDWYVTQDIPAVLRDTYRVTPGDVDIPVKAYAEALFGLRELTPSTKVEPLLTNLLQRGLPKRMGVSTVPSAEDMSLADFGLVPSGIYYTLPMSRLVTIAAAGGGVLTRLIDVCKSLRRIRIDKEGFKESGIELSVEAQAGLAYFFGSLVVVTAEPALVSNFDASPGFYKYLYGFTQTFTPLNFLDSVGASEALVATGSASQYVPATDLSYNTQFMSLKRRGEGGVDPLFSVTISTVDGPPNYPLLIRVLYNGVEIATDTITGTFGGGKQYASGPTLGYIANLIAAIRGQESPLTEGVLRSLIASAHDGKKIYKLESLILDVGRAVEYDTNLLCRFLSDWKGYGDAEQVRMMAEGLARGSPAVGAPEAPVVNARPLPTRSFMGGTVDENSHQQMTLRNITHGYSHYKFYDFIVFPATLSTKGDLLYTRITDLLARATGIINLAQKLSALSPLSAALIDGIRAGYTGVTEDTVRSQLSVPDRAVTFQPFLTTLLKYKLCNAHQFVSECRAIDAPALEDAVNAFQIPRTAFEWLKGKEEPDIGGDKTVTVSLNGIPTPISVAEFADVFEGIMNELQPNATLCASVLANLAPPRLATDDLVPLPYIQTVVFGTVPGTEIVILKQNTTIGFEPKHLTAIGSNLADILGKCTYPDVVTKSMQKITSALYAFLSSFYVPDGAEFNKEVIDRLVYEFKQPILEACETVRVGSAAAPRQEREAVTNLGRETIAGVMATRATELVNELLATLQLDTCEARMTPTGGQRGGAERLFTERIGAFFTIAPALAVSITNVGWEWEDGRVITFADGLTDDNVLYNDDGLATNEEERNEEVDMVVAAQKSVEEVPVPSLYIESAPSSIGYPKRPSVKQSTLEEKRRKRSLENRKAKQSQYQSTAFSQKRRALLDDVSNYPSDASTQSVTYDPYAAAGAPAGYGKPDTDVEFFGGLRERRPLYSNARVADVPIQPERNEGLRERRRTRRAPRIRQSARKSRARKQRDDVDSV